MKLLKHTNKPTIESSQMSSASSSSSSTTEIDKPVSNRIVDHFTQFVTPKMGLQDQFYSFTYFHENKYFHSKLEKPTQEKKQLLKSCPGPRITAFTQGSIYFPYEKKDEVLKMISYDVQAECPMYWNQIAYDVPGEGCRLVLDVDSDRVLSNTEIFKMVRILWLTLKEYYADFKTNPIDIYIAKCGPRIKKKKLSTGVHAVCHVTVSIPQAEQIIYGYNLRLKQDPAIDMKDVNVDAGIYKKGAKSCSTRMIYCNKLEKCPMCEDDTERRRACDFCNKDGIAISKSTYEPMGCIHPETGKSDADYFHAKNGEFLNIVHNYSIWPEENDGKHTYAKPCGDPQYESDKQKQVGQKRKGEVLNKQLKKIRTTDPSYALLEEYIHDLSWKGNRSWSGITITNIALTENERIAWVYITGIGSTMCPYAMKDHGDNRIWFSVTRNGVLTAYCHSDKYGCKTKDKIQFEIPGRITQHIFGLDGPPSLSKKDAGVMDERNFSFQDFMKRHDVVNRIQPDTLEDKRNKQLKRLSEFYELNK